MAIPMMLYWGQLAVLVLLATAVALLFWHFPHPSPLIRPLLAPRKRWPEGQIRHALETGRFPLGYLAYFYRDPPRHPDADQGMLAPADGLLLSADVRAGIRYVVIALSFWDMHVQRSPVAGRVVAVQPCGDDYVDWEGWNFAFLRDKHCPVQKRIVIDTAAGTFAVRLVTSLAARRIEVWVKQGDRIGRGQRIGKILLGSTVVLEVPESYVVAVPTGARVWAGQTVVIDTADHQAW